MIKGCFLSNTLNLLIISYLRDFSRKKVNMVTLKLEHYLEIYKDLVVMNNAMKEVNQRKIHIDRGFAEYFFM